MDYPITTREDSNGLAAASTATVIATSEDGSADVSDLP